MTNAEMVAAVTRREMASIQACPPWATGRGEACWVVGGCFETVCPVGPAQPKDSPRSEDRLLAGCG